MPYHPRKDKLDVIGALLRMAAAVVLLLALSWGGRRFDWLSPHFGALLLTSAILWGLFAWRLVATEEPFLPLAVLGNPVAFKVVRAPQRQHSFALRQEERVAIAA